MKKYKKQNDFGATIAEIIIVVAIVGVLASISSVSFYGFRSGQAIPNSVDEVASLLNEARSRTVSGNGGVQYGVHIQSTSTILFSGSSYSSTSTTNKMIALESLLRIASTTLTGGGSDIVFNKLTGETNQYGSFIIKNNSTTVGQKTITVSKTGLVSSN
jgi:Tfp pilus assembly protein FimT